MLFNIFYIKTDQPVTLFYMISVFDERLKAFTVQVHGVHADMDQVLCSVAALQSDRML